MFSYRFYFHCFPYLYILFRFPHDYYLTFCYLKFEEERILWRLKESRVTLVIYLFIKSLPFEIINLWTNSWSWGVLRMKFIRLQFFLCSFRGVCLDYFSVISYSKVSRNCITQRLEETRKKFHEASNTFLFFFQTGPLYFIIIY